jgi:hypothetical protein
MKEKLWKANQALLEGDRDEVLHLLRSESETTEVLWLRAHAAATEEERHELLSRLLEVGDGAYSKLTAAILEREKRFSEELLEPADYQFWKQPTWAKRFEKMRAFRVWFFGAALLLVMVLIGSFLNKSNETQYQQEVLAVQATQTASAAFSQQAAQYSSGKMTIVTVEDPTTRGVTFGETQNDQFIPVTPADGARFVAVQVNFSCDVALCPTPPEAAVNLVLTNDQILSYELSARPFLIEQPFNSLPRISLGKFIQIWFVFDVPNSATPRALQIISKEEEAPQYIAWPVR